MKKLFCLSLITAFLVGSTAFKPKPVPAPQKISKNLKRLAAWMEGHYRNKSQARKDTLYDFQEMHIVSIWNKLDKYSIWLYEETLAGDEFDEIIRQRFYQLTDLDDEQMEIAVFTITDDFNEGYEWKKDDPFADYTPDDLDAFSECNYTIKPKGDTRFIGSTYGTECELGKGEEAYTSSVFTIYETKFYRKDYVFNDFQEQVSGPIEGSKGYQFRKYDIEEEMKKEKAKSKKR